jgi:formate-dependent nitrite reductase membrane component NrfD
MLSIKKVLDQKVDDFLDRWSRLSIWKYGSIAFSTINIIDIFTTLIGLDLGFEESNFPMQGLIDLFGELGFTVVKIGVSIVIPLLLLWLYKKKSYHAKGALVGTGIASIIGFLLILKAVIINTYLILGRI